MPLLHSAFLLQLRPAPLFLSFWKSSVYVPFHGDIDPTSYPIYKSPPWHLAAFAWTLFLKGAFFKNNFMLYLCSEYFSTFSKQLPSLITHQWVCIGPLEWQRWPPVLLKQLLDCLESWSHNPWVSFSGLTICKSSAPTAGPSITPITLGRGLSYSYWSTSCFTGKWGHLLS